MILKYKTLILILVISGATMKSQDPWNINHCEVSDNLNSVHFYNEKTGWIVGDNGAMLYKTSNKWSVYPKITNEDIYSVFLTGKESGWAVGSKGTILMLDGKLWHHITSPTKATLYDVSFWDRDHGIAVGANGTILTYENGLWTQANPFTKGNLYTVSSGSEFTLISGGMEYGVVPLYTLDEINVSSPESSYNTGYIAIKDVSIQPDGHAWAVGTAGALLHHNGNEWRKIKISTKAPTLNSVTFYNKADGIAVGFSGTILKYSENGWLKENSPASVTLNGSAISESAYYAVGNNGTILSKARYSNEGHISGNTGSSLLKVDAYPNPASDYLEIIIPDTDVLNASSISVISVNGNVILKDNLDAGHGGTTYEILTSKMDNGLYVICIRSDDNKVAYGKFIVSNDR